MKAVTLELCQARLDRFDPEATVAMLAERGFDTIVCFALGYARGETYYPSKLADPHPELGARDLLGDVMRASHAHGLQAFAYVNALFGGPRHAVSASRLVPANPRRLAHDAGRRDGDVPALALRRPHR